MRGAAVIQAAGAVVALALVVLINERRRFTERAWLWGLLATSDFGAAATAAFAAAAARPPASRLEQAAEIAPLLGGALAALIFLAWAWLAHTRREARRRDLAFRIWALNVPVFFFACLGTVLVVNALR